MLKTLARLEHKVGERVYHLLCDHDAPINEVKDALSHFLAFAVEIEKKALENAKSKEDAPVEKTSEEV